MQGLGAVGGTTQRTRVVDEKSVQICWLKRVSGVQWNREERSGPLELELQATGSHLMWVLELDSGPLE